MILSNIKSFTKSKELEGIMEPSAKSNSFRALVTMTNKISIVDLFGSNMIQPATQWQPSWSIYHKSEGLVAFKSDDFEDLPRVEPPKIGWNLS